ncbi:MAG: type II toxin-antitoxin system VapC family toxin [Acidobacteriota bacterium]|nr:MAG: type II toxin-antitoxin system VapC family toxin [Acidobacteriota bacterium]
MRAILFDTSVYIASLRSGDETILQTRSVLSEYALWLSAVVLAELYAGADAVGRKKLARLERDFDKIGRLLVPDLIDWSRTGNILATIGVKYGYEQIGRGRLTNDTLLAVSSARMGIKILTINNRDFARIAEFCPLDWEIIS